MTKNFIDNLPELINNNIDNYIPYFITITFKDTFSALPKNVYRIFFSTLFEQLTQMHVNRASENPEKQPIIIMIPEASYSESKMFRHPHYHGILLVHKSRLEKFLKKCVSPLKEKEDKEGNITLAHDISDEMIGKLLSPKLKIFTSDVREVTHLEGLCGYIGKKLANMPKKFINYKHRDARKAEGFIRTYQNIEKLENHSINYDDIQVFCAKKIDK